MGKLTLILGGARSGKSNFASEMVGKSKSVLYIATYRRTDDEEMEGRIKSHQKSRPEHWEVIEEPLGLVSVIRKNKGKSRVVLIDCLTLWVSNLILRRKTAEEISGEARRLMNTIIKTNAKFILVANEVGLGVVPDTKLGRRFRDIAGRVNQIIARNADEVYFMIAGIPLKIAHRA